MSLSYLPVAKDLPSPLNQLVGREADVRAVVELLERNDVRQLTLTGPGGVGKTRLGLAAAVALQSAFADGVMFIELAALRDPDLVLGSIAQALRIRDTGQRPLLDRLTAVLRSRRCLLLLDNFEHLMAAAPIVPRLLAMCPMIKVLVTSRQALHVSGEHEYLVPPLAAPDSGPVDDLETFARVAAVELFVQRAQAVRASFRLTPANAQATAEICARLDGLPLAIELAAARIRVLSPAALLARLSGRLEVLTGGSRDAPARLQTMRAAIAWSYDTLDEQEQAALRWLGVFVSGFSLNAAEQLLHNMSLGTAERESPLRRPDAASTPKILDILTALVDKSLLVEDELPDGERRFRMLETIREFAVEQLEASGEGRSARLHLAEWCVREAAEVEARVLGADERKWLDYYDREHDNFRAALDWVLSSGDMAPETALMLAGPLWQFWFFRGHVTEGRQWLDRALEQGTAASSIAQAWGLFAAGMLAATQGDFLSAVDLLQASLPLWEVGDSRAGAARSYHGLANVAHEQVDHARALPLYEKALDRYRDPDDAPWIGLALGQLGYEATVLGDQDRGVELCRRAVAYQRQHGSPPGISTALMYLGHVLLIANDRSNAADCYRESLAIAADVGDRWMALDSLTGLARVGVESGRAASGARLIGAIEGLRERLGVPVQPRLRDLHDGAISTARSVLGDSAFASELAVGRRQTFEQAVVAAMAVADEVSGNSAEGEMARSLDEPTAGLTKRERDILRRIAAGQTDREIAAALTISPRTVANHVASIRIKLDVPSRAAAVASASRLGLF